MSAQLTILGCGSAKPTRLNTPSSQIFEMREKQFMIDCGEGAQITMQQIGAKQNRLNNIFISHLHGDHCFGLLGLLSTWGMLGRTRKITIHSQPDCKRLMTPLLAYFGDRMPYEIEFHDINPNHSEVIYDDRAVQVRTIPLKHSVPCCGFLFEEKEREPHIIGELIDVYNIPLSMIPEIKAGADFVTEDGRLIENRRLTKPADKPFKYAYCSDTAYSEKIVPLIEGVDMLYHEATYLEADIKKAHDRFHSTARQAATIAKLANVKQLMIGHYSASISNHDLLLQEARAVFENTVLAKERQTFMLS